MKNTVSEENIPEYINDADQAVIEQAKTILKKRLENQRKITGFADIADYLQMELALVDREEFHVVFMNTQHGILSTECLFTGTVDIANVYPREIVKRALMLGSSVVILVHNHPSGWCEPSKADIAITEKIKKALSLLDIRLLDHIIVGMSGTESLVQRGLI